LFGGNLFFKRNCCTEIRGSPTDFLNIEQKVRFHFADDVAIVSGAGRGIGECIAYGLAESKARIFIVDVLDQISEVKEKINRTGYTCDAMIVDAADREQVRNMVKRCINTYGKIDVLINNASVNNPSLLLDMTDDNWQKTVQNNSTSVFYCCHEVIPHMIKHGKGKTIKFSSVRAQFGAKQTAHYCAAKGGVESLSKAMAREPGPYNMQVNVISPGFIDTAMLDLMPKSQKEKLVRRIRLERLGSRTVVVGPVLFLASDASAYMTGQVLNVNGGFFMA
jgi:NAD(P)-dependent dehydrogenase (short-subunit alcohol dehydrogenase family)